jgi:hypothetical protein
LRHFIPRKEEIRVIDLDFRGGELEELNEVYGSVGQNIVSEGDIVGVCEIVLFRPVVQMRDIPGSIVPQGYRAGFLVYGEEDWVAVLGCRGRGLSAYVYGADFAGGREGGRPYLEADLWGEEREEGEGHCVLDTVYSISLIVREISLFRWL